MHFRSGRKSAQDVSLSDYIDTGTDGAPLALQDVVSEDIDLMEQVANQESVRLLRRAVDSCLTEQERLVIRLRYGLGTEEPLRQREVADRTGISRSYAHHSQPAGRRPEPVRSARQRLYFLLV